MAFVIPAHGVVASENDPTLSTGQYRILHDPAAIRFVGAPTGAGKTYAFIRAATSGKFVVFVVPTQALAADIARSANALRSAPPLAYIWDGRQSENLRHASTGVWYARKTELDQLRSLGGLLVTTPETLGQILFNVPYLTERERLDVAMILAADHLVFDETHVYRERAWGFLHFWMTAVAFRVAQFPNQATRLTFLSATHSNMWDTFSKQPEVLPSIAWTQFDESVSEKSSGPGFRWLHGDVRVSVHPDRSVRDLASQILPQWLADGHRILILYDSIRELANDTPHLAALMRQAGIEPEAGMVISGQDRQADQDLSNSGLRAGIQPDSGTRVIVGTSAVEMGVTYEGVTHAIIAPGTDAAAWLQRVGRVARGAIPGEIWTAKPPSTMEVFYNQLVTWDREGGNRSIADIRQTFGVLRSVNGPRAAILGAAYWGMLYRKARHIYAFLRQAHEALTDSPPPSDGLSAIYHTARTTGGQIGGRVLSWITAVDRTLQDIRGFLPTVHLRFQGGPIITYNREWAIRWLEPPDRVSDDGVWEYARARSDVLRDRPIMRIERLVLLPDDDIRPIQIDFGRGGEANAVDEYRRYIRSAHLPNELKNSIHDWVRRSQLLIVIPDPLPLADSATF